MQQVFIMPGRKRKVREDFVPMRWVSSSDEDEHGEVVQQPGHQFQPVPQQQVLQVPQVRDQLNREWDAVHDQPRHDQEQAREELNRLWDNVQVEEPQVQEDMDVDHPDDIERQPGAEQLQPGAQYLQPGAEELQQELNDQRQQSLDEESEFEGK